MNEVVDITLEEYEALLAKAQRYDYLRQWARNGRGYAWQLGVTLFTEARTFDEAIDETIRKRKGKAEMAP